MLNRKLFFLMVTIIIFILLISIVVLVFLRTKQEEPAQDETVIMFDAGAYIIVWHDINGDGLREEDEPLMPGICVWAGYDPYYLSEEGAWEKVCSNSYYLTREDGSWDDFFPGGRCVEVNNAIFVPEGYSATTPTEAIGCAVEFGLIQK